MTDRLKGKRIVYDEDLKMHVTEWSETREWKIYKKVDVERMVPVMDYVAKSKTDSRILRASDWWSMKAKLKEAGSC